MAEINSTEAKRDGDSLFEIMITIEDASELLNSYVGLLFDTSQYMDVNSKKNKLAANHIYALLEAIQPQLKRLNGVTQALARHKAVLLENREGGAA